MSLKPTLLYSQTLSQTRKQNYTPPKKAKRRLCIYDIIYQKFMTFFLSLPSAKNIYMFVRPTIITAFATPYTPCSYFGIFFYSQHCFEIKSLVRMLLNSDIKCRMFEASIDKGCIYTRIVHKYQLFIW